MEDLSNMIKSPVGSSGQDSFWEDLPGEIQHLSPAGVLVISQAFEQGSAEEVQLQKILQACKLVAGQYNLVKIKEGDALSWHKLRELLQPQTVLLFGVFPQQLGISAMFHLFAPNHFNDCTWIASPSLPELEQQPEAKKQLWQHGLKPIFDNPA